MRTFHCPLWNAGRCSCPDGTIEDFCPGHAIELPEPSALDRLCNYLATHHWLTAAIVIAMAWAASAYAGGPI